MDPRFCAEIKESGRGLEPTYHFMINCLLYSRMETGLASNQDCYDEDVNVYLAHLLHSFLNPDYVEQSRKYLSKYDADVFRRLQTASDARLKYAIYKTDSDFLLVSIGIFDQPVTPGQAEKVKPAEEAYVGRGKSYYHFAYRTRSRSTGATPGSPRCSRSCRWASRSTRPSGRSMGGPRPRRPSWPASPDPRIG